MSLGNLTESRIGLLAGPEYGGPLSVFVSRRLVVVICDCVDCCIVRNGLLPLGLNALQAGVLAITAAAIAADINFIFSVLLYIIPFTNNILMKTTDQITISQSLLVHSAISNTLQYLFKECF